MLRHVPSRKKFLLEALPPPNSMLEDDGNAADEFTTMFSAIKSTLKWGEGDLWEYMLIICKREGIFNTQSTCVSTTSVYDCGYSIYLKSLHYLYINDVD